MRFLVGLTAPKKDSCVIAAADGCGEGEVDVDRAVAAELIIAADGEGRTVVLGEGANDGLFGAEGEGTRALGAGDGPLGGGDIAGGISAGVFGHDHHFGGLIAGPQGLADVGVVANRDVLGMVHGDGEVF